MNELFAKKKLLERKLNSFHYSFHKYRNLSLFSISFFLFLVFFMIVFGKKIRILPIFLSLYIVFSFVSLCFFIYSQFFFFIYRKKLEECSYKISRLNKSKG